MDTDRPDEVATAAAANSRDKYGGRLKAKPLVCTTVKLGVDMLKKSKPACTASSPSVALFDRNPIRIFPLFDPGRHAETTRKGRAAGNREALTGQSAKGMSELAVGSRPRGVGIARKGDEEKRDVVKARKSGYQSNEEHQSL